MLTSLKNLLFRNGNSSKSLAKSRLHFVLVQDRTGLTNEELAGFKKELINVIERYFVIDEHGFDIAYKRDPETTTLLINSPIIVRRQDSISGKVGSDIAQVDKKKKGKEADQKEAQVAGS